MVDKIGRNDPCSCGSGKKFKNCCFQKQQQKKSGLGGRKFTAKVLSGKPKEHLQEQNQTHVKPAVDYNTLMERSFGAALYSHSDKPPVPVNPSEYLISDKESNS